MNLEHDDFGMWTLHLTDNTFIHPIFEWSQLRPGFNWRTFHLIHVMYEQDAMLASHEAEVVILGLGFRIRINGDWNKTETGREILETMDEISNRTATAVHVGKSENEHQGGQ